ncbi:MULTISPECIES: TonB family protein [unclassified Bradyrhizobium]
MDEQPFETINVVPLVDIMLVLLTMVLTTANFIATGRIPVALPQASHSQAQKHQDKTIDLTADGRLYLGWAIPVEGRTWKPSEILAARNVLSDTRRSRDPVPAVHRRDRCPQATEFYQSRGTNEKRQIELGERWSKQPMSDPTVKRRLRVTLPWCLVASIALHLLLGLPLILHAFAEPPDEPPVLVVELQGAAADIQTEQKVMQDTKAAPEQQAQSGRSGATDPQPPDDRPPDAAESPSQQYATPPAPRPEEPTPSNEGSTNVSGGEQKQDAHTIKAEQTEADRLREYAKLLSKKVRAHLVNPGGGHASSATVTFFILSNGRIRSDSLKIVTSSGQSKVDASALQTIRASAPFDPPPKEMSITIVVDFDRRS